MNPSYEIWSKTGTPLLSFDREDRARAEMKRRRIPKARLVRVTRVVEEIS